MSILDVCQPAMASQAADYHAHWALTHSSRDGHHKLQAAAEAGLPLQLHSLLSIEGSLATADQAQSVPSIRSRPRSSRPSANPNTLPNLVR